MEFKKWEKIIREAFGMINVSLLHFVFAVLTSFFLAATESSAHPGFLSVGPLVHFNFGGGSHSFSYGFEAAYWNLWGYFPWSIDLGLEGGNSHFRIYSETQTGIALAGFSTGPVLDMSPDKGTVFGWQNSLWADYFFGLDLRWRSLGGSTEFCPGLFGKLPLSLRASDWDGNGTGVHHHHHWHD